MAIDPKYQQVMPESTHPAAPNSNQASGWDKCSDSDAPDMTTSELINESLRLGRR